MSAEPTVTIVGNLTADPDRRFTKTGQTVVNFTIASTPRVKDSQGQWADGDPLFVHCVAWRRLAESIAEGLRKGSRVIAQGRMRAQSWTTSSGERRTGWELEIDDIGTSLRYRGRQADTAQQPSSQDPWAAQTRREAPF